MGYEHKWILEEGGHIFERCDIFLKIHSPHTVSQAVFVYACSTSATPLLSCICL